MKIFGVPAVAVYGVSLLLVCGAPAWSLQQQAGDDALAPPPEEDSLTPPPIGPSELDDLSQTTATEGFPDLTSRSSRRPVSVTVRALNKVTAKYTDLSINMDGFVDFGSLTIRARFCDKRPPEEFPETTAFLQIYDRGNVAPTPSATAANDGPAAVVDPLPKGERVFSGWMFASTPALSPLDHPVYDVWVIDCKTVSVDN